MTVSGPFYLFRRGRIYYVQYALDGVTKQKSTGCTTKGAATAYVELLRDKVSVRPAKAIRLSEYLRDYLTLKQGILRQSTLIRIDQIGRIFLRTSCDKLLASFTVRDVEDYKSVRLKSCCATTVNIEIRHLKAVFGTAVKLGHLEKSPFAGCSQIAVPQKTPSFMTLKEARKLIASIQDQVFRDIVHLSILTGLRLGEALSLDWSQVDLKNRLITLTNLNGFVTKSGKIRMIPFPESAKRILNVLKKRGSKTSELVFANRWGKRYSNSYVSRSFKKYIRAADLPESLHFHSTRHTYASWLIERGVSLYEIQKLLGHSSQAVTQLYSHLTGSQLRSAVDRLPRI
jgi:integrase